MHTLKNITKEQHNDFVKQCNDLNQFNLIYQGRCLGCFYDNELIGLIEYNSNATTEYLNLEGIYSGNKITRIGLLYVKEGHRNIGVGTLLLTELFNKLPKGKALVLEADKTEKHRAFYVKNNFTEIKEWIFIKIK